jgi:hypothetical protein
VSIVSIVSTLQDTRHSITRVYHEYHLDITPRHCELPGLPVYRSRVRLISCKQPSISSYERKTEHNVAIAGWDGSSTLTRKSLDGSSHGKQEKVQQDVYELHVRFYPQHSLRRLEEEDGDLVGSWLSHHCGFRHHVGRHLHVSTLYTW